MTSNVLYCPIPPSPDSSHWMTHRIALTPLAAIRIALTPLAANRAGVAVPHAPTPSVLSAAFYPTSSTSFPPHFPPPLPMPIPLHSRRMLGWIFCLCWWSCLRATAFKCVHTSTAPSTGMTPLSPWATFVKGAHFGLVGPGDACLHAVKLLSMYRPVGPAPLTTVLSTATPVGGFSWTWRACAAHLYLHPMTSTEHGARRACC